MLNPVGGLIEPGLLGQPMYIHELPFDTPACTKHDCRRAPGIAGARLLNGHTGV